MVMKKSGGEYTDIEGIVKRFETLTATHRDLTGILGKKEAHLGQMKNDAITYEKNQNTEIMKLNNQIAKLNTQFEEIDNKKTKLKAEEEETSTKQLSKITQLSKILMAINQLETFCVNRNKKNDESNAEKQKKGKTTSKGLNYETKTSYKKHDKNADFYPDWQQGTFNNYSERTMYAEKQLETIGQYLQDFGSVIKDLEIDKNATKIAQK